MNRTLMVGAVLTAAALAGCGGATQTASDTASAPATATVAASSPGAASQPARSSESSQSRQSARPDQPAHASQPGQSTKPTQSGQSGQSATPEPVTKPGQATKTGQATPSAEPTQPAADAGTAFTAYGRNTPWRAVVQKGTLTTEGPSVGEHTLRVTRSAWSKGVQFTGSDRGQKFSLVVRPGACVDGSGQDTGQVATLSVGNRQLSGCAVSGAYPHANT